MKTKNYYQHHILEMKTLPPLTPSLKTSISITGYRDEKLKITICITYYRDENSTTPNLEYKNHY